MCVLATIKSYEFFDKFFEDNQLHPEIRKQLETIEYHVNHNLPIEKKILFEALPELFTYEIGKLSEDERTKYRRRRIEIVSSDGVLSTGEQLQQAMLNREYEVDKLNEMNWYHYFATMDFLDKYSLFLDQAMSWGWESRILYLNSLYQKNPKSLTIIEKLMLEEMKELDLISEEINVLYEAIKNRELDTELPFPMDEKFKREFIANIEYAKKFRTVNLNDTALVPYEVPEETFMDRLMKIEGVDIKEEIRKSNEKVQMTIDSGLPLKGRDLNVKDPEIIRQINIISQAVKVESPIKQVPLKYEIPLDYVEENMLGQTPTKGRILIEEYYKSLYLNNEDYEKYNFTYWQQYFGVEKNTLRNIFNYIFFPIPDERNPSEVGKILYFKDFDFDNRRKMIAEMSAEDYNEYLENTEDRPELQEKDRLEYLVFQTTATEPRVSERTVPTIDEEIDAQIDKPLIHSDIIRSVDEKIHSLVSNELEKGHISGLEKDVELSLNEIRRKRLESKVNETKRIEEMNSDVLNIDEARKFIKDNDMLKLPVKSSKPDEPEIVEK